MPITNNLQMNPLSALPQQQNRDPTTTRDNSALSQPSISAFSTKQQNLGSTLPPIGGGFTQAYVKEQLTAKSSMNSMKKKDGDLFLAENTIQRTGEDFGVDLSASPVEI